MQEVHVINTIIVPEGMEAQAESARAEYVRYFQKQDGFVGSTFYKSLEREPDGAVKYVNVVVWETRAHFERVVNQGFQNAQGENSDGLHVLGKGLPEPMVVSPGLYSVIETTGA